MATCSATRESCVGRRLTQSLVKSRGIFYMELSSAKTEFNVGFEEHFMGKC